MKVYCLMHDNYDERNLLWVYKTWAEAYDAAAKHGWDGLWYIEIYDIDQPDSQETTHYIAERKSGWPFGYRSEHSRDIDPSEADDDNVVWGHA